MHYRGIQLPICTKRSAGFEDSFFCDKIPGSHASISRYKSHQKRYGNQALRILPAKKGFFSPAKFSFWHISKNPMEQDEPYRSETHQHHIHLSKILKLQPFLSKHHGLNNPIRKHQPSREDD